MAEEVPRFTMTEAALDVFRRRERRGVLIGATLFFYAMVVLLVGVFLVALWPTFAEVGAWFPRVAASETPPELIFPPGAPRLLVGILLFQLCYSLLLAMYEAACLRWLVREETRGFFGFALDADAWRVWASYWIWLALYVVFLAVPLSLILLAVYMVQSGANAGGAVLLAFLAVLAAFAGGAWLAVRLAPATAASIAAKRFAFFEAWKVTRGRFGSMLGAFFLVFVAYYIASSVIQALAAPVFFGAMFEFSARIQTGAEPSLETLLAPFLAPWAIAALSAVVLLSVAAAALLRLAYFGINARAVRVARGEGRV